MASNIQCAPNHLSCGTTQAAAIDLTTLKAVFVAHKPVGRPGRTEAIAALAVYMTSDAAAFITGTAKVIAGGRSNQDREKIDNQKPCSFSPRDRHHETSSRWRQRR